MIEFINNNSLIIDVIVLALIITNAIMFLFFSKASKRYIISLSISIVFLAILGIFKLYASLLIGAILLIIFAFNKPASKSISKRGIMKAKLTEDEKTFNTLAIAVEQLSKTQTGALITIEKHDNLDDISRLTGTIINAEVSNELIQSIFYKGTLLHDGAMIIKNNLIYSAAVFYQPTQKALRGKYGSRHRAAIGISEISDSITIIVSEETGKITLAYKGELIHTNNSDFKDKLINLYRR